MKQFLKKVFLFLGFTLLLNLAGNFFFSQGGNKIFEEKTTYLKESGVDGYSVFFFGSSHVFRQLIPSEFSKHCSFLEDRKIFNLGAPATFPPESYYLCEHFFDQFQLSGKTRYAFLELLPPAGIADENLFSRQNYYWRDAASTAFTARYFYEKDQSSFGKGADISKVFLSYLMTKAGFNYLYFPGTSVPDSSDIGKNRYGFYSLADNEQQLLARGDSANEISEFRKLFEKDTASLSKQAMRVNKVFRKTNHPLENYDQIYLGKLEQMIRDFDKRNIHIVFIIAPRLAANDYEELLSLKQALPESRVIEIADPERYPELWTVNNSFDRGHLNNKGAALFTEDLAERADTILRLK